MKTVKQSVIYAIRNLVSGRLYIGSTSNFKVRKAVHLSQLRRNKHHSLLLQRAFNKYGEVRFAFDILESVSEADDLIVREQLYLDTKKPLYNVVKQVNKTQLGIPCSPERRERIQQAMKGKQNSKGRVLSEDTKAKIRLSEKGKIISEMTRQKQSAARIGRIPWNKGLSVKNGTLSLTEKAKKGMAAGRSNLISGYHPRSPVLPHTTESLAK